MDPRWRIELLGRFRATLGARTITRFRSQKTAALLAYLAYYRDRAHPRSVLAEMFWPESDPELARHNLNVALSSLREQFAAPDLGGAVVISDRVTIGLDPEGVMTDVSAFETALHSAAAASDVRRGRSISPKRSVSKEALFSPATTTTGYSPSRSAWTNSSSRRRAA